VYVKVDKQFLVEELYRLKKHVPAEETEARKVLQEILEYVNTATVLDDPKSKLPGLKGMRG